VRRDAISLSRPGNIMVRVSFTTGAVRSAILATAGLLVFLSYGPGLTSMQHTTSHTTAVQSPSHFQSHILIGKQWYQLREFIRSKMKQCEELVMLL